MYPLMIPFLLLAGPQAPPIARPALKPVAPLAGPQFAFGPWKPSPTTPKEDTPLSLALTVKNLDPNKSKQTPAPLLHIRIQPLDGGTVPGMAPGAAQLRQVTCQYALYGGEDLAYFLHWPAPFKPGSYRVAASRDAAFSQPVLPDFTFSVQGTPLQLLELKPVTLQSSPNAQPLTLVGSGFQPGSQVLVQAEGKAPVPAPLKALPPSANPLQMLVADVTVSTGTYKVWVRTGSGKESAPLALKVIKPWIGQPFVSSVTPNPVRFDELVALNGGYTASLTLRGQGFTPAFWAGVTAFTQTGSYKRPLQLKAVPDPQSPLERGTLYLTMDPAGLGPEVLAAGGLILLMAPGSTTPLSTVPFSQVAPRRAK